MADDRESEVTRAALLLVALVVAAAGTAAADPRHVDSRVLVITWSVQGSAALTRDHDRYEEVGNATIVWRVPVSELTPGRRFRQTSATVIGTTKVVDGTGPRRSCFGALSIGRRVFELQFVGPAGSQAPRSYTAIDFVVPNPFESATSPTCAHGPRASHPARPDPRRKRWWHNYTRIHVTLLRPSFHLYPKWNPVGVSWSFPPTTAVGETSVSLQFAGWIRIAVRHG